MNEQVVEAILEDIVDQPDDPSLWLILADYLEDNEDPRGELVRLTYHLHHEQCHADFEARQSRLQELLIQGVQPVRPRRILGDMEFVWVPPLHYQVQERGFWIGSCPVTQAQWQSVMGNSPSFFSREGEGTQKVELISDTELARFPVENVSWNDSQLFCSKLSQMLGVPVRLPNEAEWKYACRAGTRTRFHFGEVEDYALAHLQAELPTIVGCYPPNAWGLFDCFGNVWEFCEDNDLVPNTPRVSGKVVCGGSYYWTRIRDTLGCYDFRCVGYRHVGHVDTGFRVLIG
jgi:uncharacterized protein (TIGR02996 family)